MMNEWHHHQLQRTTVVAQQQKSGGGDGCKNKIYKNSVEFECQLAADGLL